MERRLKLQELLESFFEDSDTRDTVHYQPPEGVELQLDGYPSIVYGHDFTNAQFADNRPYIRTKRYSVTVMDYDPDSPLFDKVEELPGTLLIRTFAANQLNHKIYSVYF